MWPSATSWMWNSVDGGPDRHTRLQLEKTGMDIITRDAKEVYRRDPIRYLKKMGILDSDGHPTRMGQFTKT
ncbi:hypothetical protein Tcan_08398 [Toxocara canis]|uniref:Uncharacterized protein n=1 Tax=Toxocara canis TaxID=6265 RepID=A0A0B2VU15_TOXCA|nr:hypothetical protein Tcan_08398 [Toxocara canis]